MRIILKHSAAPEVVRDLVEALRARGFAVAQDAAALVVAGDCAALDAELLAHMPCVLAVERENEPPLLASRAAHAEDTCVRVGAARIGGGHFALIAGPCAVENEVQLLAAARAVKAAGADILRGGAFKPRTSPYEFQGLGREGVRLLELARRETGLPVVTEIVDPRDLELLENMDMLQVGARSMQNFALLKELGRCQKPVLLKRGMGCTLRELLLSAEYLLSAGNGQVVLCERGVRGFDSAVRSTLDLSAVPLLHEMSHLPVLVDPCHAVGQARFVPPMALAAAACGADGVMLEVHCDPLSAQCDGAQALRPAEFAALAEKLRAVREAAR